MTDLSFYFYFYFMFGPYSHFIPKEYSIIDPLSCNSSFHIFLSIRQNQKFSNVSWYKFRFLPINVFQIKMKITYLIQFLHDLKPFFYNFTTSDFTAQKIDFCFYYFSFNLGIRHWIFFLPQFTSHCHYNLIFPEYLQVISNIQELWELITLSTLMMRHQHKN